MPTCGIHLKHKETDTLSTDRQRERHRERDTERETQRERAREKKGKTIHEMSEVEIGFRDSYSSQVGMGLKHRPEEKKKHKQT